MPSQQILEVYHMFAYIPAITSTYIQALMRYMETDWTGTLKPPSSVQGIWGTSEKNFQT
jgi:hypothetical protein